MQLWLVRAFTSGVHECQHFRECRQSFRWLSHRPLCFCEERQKTWLHCHCSCGTVGSQALGHLLDTFLHLSLVCQCPAAHESTDRHPVGKSLFHGKGHGGFSAFLGATRLTTERMEHGSSTQGKTEAKGVRHLLCQRQCIVRLFPSLGWIPQTPQRPGSKAAARHPSVLPMEKRQGAVLLGVVQGYPLGKMRMRSRDRAPPE